MKNLKICFFAALCACTLVSCLDQYPEDEIPADEALKTVDDIDQAVIGIYDAWKDGALYSGYLTLLPDLQADLAYAVKGYSNKFGDIWRWNILATNSEITAVYASLYSVIGSCNFVLSNADKVRANTFKDEDLDRLEQYCGEAHFSRALAYAELIKLFCESYESDEEAEKTLGVVLKNDYYGKEPMKRSSLAASYQQVLNDLAEAEKLLAVDDDFEGTFYNYPYITIYAVHALQARVALYMKRYEDAIKYASKIIDSKKFILSSATASHYAPGESDYEFMWTTDNSTEVIWKIAFTPTSYGGALGQVFFNYDYVSVRPDYVPASWVLKLYDANDMRQKAFFQEFTTGHSHGLKWPLLVKYWGNRDLYAQAQLLQVCMPKVFRLSEQYLIRAEAYAQLEKPDYGKATRDIKTLRSERYKSGGGVSLNEKNAMKVIEEERVKELYMEGFRLMDLKRWHKGFERKPQDQSLSNGSSLKVEADDPLFVWPIPQHELESPGADIEPNKSNK